MEVNSIFIYLYIHGNVIDPKKKKKQHVTVRAKIDQPPTPSLSYFHAPNLYNSTLNQTPFPSISSRLFMKLRS